jgi:hypothetical protein
MFIEGALLYIEVVGVIKGAASVLYAEVVHLLICVAEGSS